MDFASGTAVGAGLEDDPAALDDIPEPDPELAAGAADPALEPESMPELELAAGAEEPELAGAAGCSAGADVPQATASTSAR